MRFFASGPLVVLGLSICGVQSALANSHGPAGYYAYEVPGHVAICVNDWADKDEDRTCQTEAGGILRQDSQGHVVSITACHPDDPECFMDECPAPGTYKYGFEKPLECVGEGSEFYVEFTVDAYMFPDCQPTSGAPLPQAFDGNVPWGSEIMQVCDSGGCSGTGRITLTVFLANGIVGLGALLLLRRRRR